jgi:putative tryptophan/tyrosine transport system substrate-binding protein
MNNRRKIICALGAGALVAPFGVRAQSQNKVWRVGFLGPASAASYATRMEALRAGLRDFGYVEGKNLVIESRWAEGNYERFPEFAAEFVRMKVDVMVTSGTPGARAAKDASATVPVVMAEIGGDPVAAGIIASLARPGGHVTGSTFFSPELAAKRLELLKEISPRITHAAGLHHADKSARFPMIKAVEARAKRLKMTFHHFESHGPEDFANVFAAMAKTGVNALVIQEDAIFNVNLKAIAALAAKHRILSAGGEEYAAAGGLLAYGVDFPVLFRRAAYFIDRIFKGTKPADLPVEQANVYTMVLNRKIAKALGVTIPNTILQRADKVIE